jgi:hypothetical protein
LTFLFLELQALTGDFDELVGWKSFPNNCSAFTLYGDYQTYLLQHKLNLFIYYFILIRLFNETFTWSEMLVRKQK